MLFVGLPVIYLHRCKGGYGFEYPVNAIIIKINKKTIKIKVQTKNGDFKEINVKPDRLHLINEKYREDIEE